MKQKKHKKIAIFCWRDPYNPRSGGAEYVTLKHALSWIAQGHLVSWFSAAVPNKKTDFSKDKIQFHRFGSEKLFFLMSGWQYWVRSKRNFDVVIDQVHGLPNFLPLIIGEPKKIMLIHEVAGKIWEYMFPWPLSWVGKTLEEVLLSWWYKQTPAWVDSLSTKQDLVSIGLSAENIQVIPCAIDARSPMRIQKEKTLTLIFLARLVKMKGVEFAITVAKQLIKKNPSARLWIVGDGDPKYLAHLQKVVKKLRLTDSIEFIGKVTEDKKCELLRRAHFLLHTSVKEGFGLTVLEANAQQTPAAIFDVGSLNELVVNAKTGVVAPFHNEKKLAQKILAVYSKKAVYKRMCKKAFAFQKKYTWAVFTRLSTTLVEDV